MTLRLLLAIVLTVGLGRSASPSAANEYDLKAAFLINFSRYVEWPANAFHGNTDPMVICIAGTDPFGQTLDDMAAGKSIGGRPLAVRRLTGGRPSADCRVLYIASSGQAVPAAAAGAPPPGCAVLTVAEESSPAAENAVITFVLEDGRVRFAVNMRAAALHRLQVSSRLLGLATTVRR
jgi:hypothetical protein